MEVKRTDTCVQMWGGKVKSEVQIPEKKSTVVQQQSIGQFGVRGVCTQVMQCSTTVISFCHLFRNRSPLKCGKSSNYDSPFEEVSGSNAPPPVVAGLHWLVPLKREVARC